MQGTSQSPDDRLEVHAAKPKGCAKPAFDHSKDGEMEMHGSIDKPIEVPDLHQGKYVNWEYSYINRTGLFHYCLQQLLREKAGDREFDRMVVRDYSGMHHVFYFDITKAMKTGGKEMEKAYEDYQAGRPIDLRDRKAIEAAIKLKKDATRRNN